MMDSKRMKNWLRALEIAKILFEDEGYHTLYLEEIEEFIKSYFNQMKRCD